MLLMFIPCAEGWTELAFPELGPCTVASAGWRRMFATSCAIASLSSSPKRSWVGIRTCSWVPSESDMTRAEWCTLSVYEDVKESCHTDSERSTFKFYSNRTLWDLESRHWPIVLQYSMTPYSNFCSLNWSHFHLEGPMTNWLNKFGITDQLTVTDRGVYLVTLGISDFLTDFRFPH